jgi:hypothetical protein
MDSPLAAALRVRGALLAAPPAPGIVADVELGPVATVRLGRVWDRELEDRVEVVYYHLTNAARELLRAAGLLPWRGV